MLSAYFCFTQTVADFGSANEDATGSAHVTSAAGHLFVNAIQGYAGHWPDSIQFHKGRWRCVTD